ncbi:class I SAM-dependent methyltransferase [Dyella sp.]|uniref:class I SAM-dependent methyltransferase n=1 Tax=Dyella sp. TaxID=1869338 RepID=UPI002ED430DC
MDVGVGTGYYPAHADLAADSHITLVDLNAHTLSAAAARLSRQDTTILMQDVFEPAMSLPDRHYDSIALFYLLHCLPGSMKEKVRVFENLKPKLAQGGKLYGATILGDAAEHNRFGRKLMDIYNRKGIFGNRLDTLDALHEALHTHFNDVQLEQRGKVALFVAQMPRF